jgi:hypothetical protein
MSSELDAPGEYYLDRSDATLYFCPPDGDATRGKAVLSVGDYVVTLGASTAAPCESPHRTLWDGVGASVVQTVATECASASPLQFVSLSGFSVLFSRGTGVYAPAVQHTLLSSLEVSNHGATAVSVAGSNNQLTSIVAAGAGCTAVLVTGGDEATLTRGDNVVSGCDISQYSRITRVYTPGVAFYGVGNTFSGNRIHDAPHQAITGVAV